MYLQEAKMILESINSYNINNVNYINELKELDLPLEKCILSASSTLALYNIRKNNDIDCSVTMDVWNKLKKDKRFKYSKLKNSNSEELSYKHIRIYNNEWPLKYTVEELLKNKDKYLISINGYNFYNLDLVKLVKNITKRQKDLNDLNLIMKYEKLKEAKIINQFLTEINIINSNNHITYDYDKFLNKQKPLIILGLSGAGKSTLGKAISDKIGCKYIEEDKIDTDKWPPDNKAIMNALNQHKFFVYEGIHIMNIFTDENIEKYSFVIVNTSLINSSIRAYKRNKKLNKNAIDRFKFNAGLRNRINIFEEKLNNSNMKKEKLDQTTLYTMINDTSH